MTTPQQLAEQYAPGPFSSSRLARDGFLAGYRSRDAEVAALQERAEHIQRLHVGIVEDQDAKYLALYGTLIAKDKEIAALRSLLEQSAQAMHRHASDHPCHECAMLISDISAALSGKPPGEPTEEPKC